MTKKNALSKKEIKEFSIFFEKYQYEVNKKDLIFKVKDEKGIEYLEQSGKIIFFIINNELIPSFDIVENLNLKKIFIDKNAVKFIYSGADLMKPGIIEIEDGIKKDEIVLIALKEPFIPVEYGISNFDFEEMKSMDSGKVVRNLKIRKYLSKD
ncbi:MAG: hypothetical protein PHT94_02825 [Candidatus Nanoarchaeia archaeon]|nr:hypothetical protein [Candidatus Nanoarchaeia archaeon]